MAIVVKFNYNRAPFDIPFVYSAIERERVIIKAIIRAIQPGRSENIKFHEIQRALVKRSSSTKVLSLHLSLSLAEFLYICIYRRYEFPNAAVAIFTLVDTYSLDSWHIVDIILGIDNKLLISHLTL